MLLIYIIVVFGMVIVTSALLMYVLNKMELLNYRMILAVSLSSILAGLLFPGIFNLISIGKGVMVDGAQLTFVLTATLVLYIMLVFILSLVISIVIPDSKFATIASGIQKVGINHGLQAPAVEKTQTTGDDISRQERNYLEEIYGSLVVETANKGSNVDDNAQQVENNLEKSVDSVENIDKMRLETFEQDVSVPDDSMQQIETYPDVDIICEEDAAANVDDMADKLSLDECVDEAFRLKSQGDCEGAILYFMYALDRKPGKDLAFWIVLDICVLYKSLGQADFARDMLATYFDTYNGDMDKKVRDEIESNLKM